ncbi:MAG TPA: helix-turn-helix transcriptional regulator [Mycobacteriales bacterium]|nr:helix-turn-helix transcriptional regulator [Mycobacteriales bacterium]
MHALAHDDLRALDGLLAQAHEEADGSVGLPNALLTGLYDLVRCEMVTFCELDTASGTDVVVQDFDGVHHLAVDRPCPEDPFYRHFWSTRSTSYALRTGDTRTVTSISDFYDQREWLATPMYQDVFKAHGVRHHLSCSLSSRGARGRRLVLFRGPGADFDGRDRLLLSLLRPHLDELYRRQSALRGGSPAVLLTPRQAELLAMVATGRTNAQIAATLFLSPGTVRKHLENIFARLGVTSRAAAVGRVFSEQPPAEPGLATYAP